MSAKEAENRVVEFLSEFHHSLKTMSRNKFASHRKSVSQEKLEPDDSMGDEARRFYGEITSARYDFRSWEKEASRVMDKCSDKSSDNFRTIMIHFWLYVCYYPI